MPALLLIFGMIVALFTAVSGVWYLLRRSGKRVERECIPVRSFEHFTANADADTPYASENTDPVRRGFAVKMELDGEPIQSYSRPNPIFFDAGDVYPQSEGIVTFRGNNYRDSASFGTPNIARRKFGRHYWSVKTGALEKSDVSKGKGSKRWTGSGWTGQPLIVRWDESGKQAMNLYPDKKAKPGLVEAVYATMDGNVYFIDIEDGQPTRDTIEIGLPFKGAGALHPSLPMLFVGAGDSLPDSAGEAGYARAFIYSLVNGEKLYEFGAKDPFAPRIFHGYDSSPLVDTKTDTLIYPGENNIVYTMKLNTSFDKDKPELSIKPAALVKWTYSTPRTSEESHWWGFEDSAAYYKNFMFLADNGGNMICLDVNTMELIWAQDVKDDTNASPVFEITETGEKYLYVAPSLHWEMDKVTQTGEVCVYKLNAINGEIIWEKPYLVHSIYGISGGVQATPVLGKGPIADLMIVPIARTPYRRKGLLVALDKQTGEERWVMDMPHYAWSSPVCVYAQDGQAYIVQCDSKGNMYLIDGASGLQLDKINLGSNIEASPAVFENTVVVGTRGGKIVGVTIE
ncbi:MAG: PQQ-binding-like beta-propeller repeat protein [Propionibacteriaceae bacterium]|nr:PQQ-binding-like beta-propeller repeat protein [Propionibacteriaceae bacterium]